jgi:hypothetical protein
LILLCGLLLPASGTTAQETEDPPVYMGRALVFEADLDRGVELGWLSADHSADEVMERIAESLNGRLLRTGRFVEGVARREEGNRVSVTFVGRQAGEMEQMLIAGMSAAGRMTLHALPTDADLASCGSSREEESARLEAWLAGQPAGEVDPAPTDPAPADPTPVSPTPMSRFDHVERTAGGPCDAIRWLPRWETDVEALGPAVAVLRAAELLIRPADVESFELVSPSEQTVGLSLSLLDPARARLEGFREAAAGREVAFAVDSAVAWSWPSPQALSDPLVLEGRFDVSRFRAIVMAFAAEPLPAPLRFVGFEERELPNVKIRDSPTAID